MYISWFDNFFLTIKHILAWAFTVKKLPLQNARIVELLEENKEDFPILYANKEIFNKQTQRDERRKKVAFKLLIAGIVCLIIPPALKPIVEILTSNSNYVIYQGLLVLFYGIYLGNQVYHLELRPWSVYKKKVRSYEFFVSCQEEIKSFLHKKAQAEPEFSYWLSQQYAFMDKTHILLEQSVMEDYHWGSLQELLEQYERAAGFKKYQHHSSSRENTLNEQCFATEEEKNITVEKKNFEGKISTLPTNSNTPSQVLYANAKKHKI